MDEYRRWMRRLAVALGGLIVITIGVPHLTGGSAGFIATAMADDDDDGDDDGGGGASSSRGGRDGGSRKWKPRRSIFDTVRPSRPAKRQRAARRPTRPAFAPAELIGRNIDSDDVARLRAAGYTILEQITGASGGIIYRLRIPPRLTLGQARAEIAAASPQATIDLNHYYRPDAGTPCAARECLARHMIGWTPANADMASCSAGLRIGMIDTAINAEHDALEGSRIEVKRLAGDELPVSGKQHGTAVAALLVGNPDGRSPGLVPEATLIAVDAFHRFRGGSDISDAYSLVKGLGYLDSRGVDIINLSFTGPPNAVLEDTIGALARKGIVIVAAAGNDGPRAKPLYPAAYPEVVAVTAVDRNKRPYRRAARGAHIDIAAPGVNVWIAASVEGSRPRTGTSFAAPFVTAALALARKHAPGTEGNAALMRVTNAAEDLGAPGKDDIFGWGLLNPRGLCG